MEMGILTTPKAASTVQNWYFCHPLLNKSPEMGNRITPSCRVPCNGLWLRWRCWQHLLKPNLPGFGQFERLFPLLPAPNLPRVGVSWRGVWGPAALELEFPTGECILSRIQLSLPGSASALSGLLGFLSICELPHLFGNLH